MNIDILRDVLIPAAENPDEHYHCWAVNSSYTSNNGPGMIMTAVKWISSGNDHWRQRTHVLQRMISTDNGATWQKHGAAVASGSPDSGNQTFAWSHFLDPSNERLLSIHQETRPNPSGGAPRTTLHYQISVDGGQTWGPCWQLVHRGDDFDATRWMPGISDKRYVGVDQLSFARLDDGTIVFGICLLRYKPDFPKEQLYDGVIFFRGRWTDDAQDLTWEAGDFIRVPSSVSPYGVDEPDLVHLGGQRLLTTLRCQGEMEPHGLFSTRQWSVSEDGGRTWSAPQMLRNDDGSMVCVPASLAAFEKDPTTGKIYWFANILGYAVTRQMPRYPLTIAELDPRRLCIIKDSVTIIQDLPPGAPANRAYSNFGHYIDRATGEFVLMVAERPMINDFDYRADTLRFRIRVQQ